MTQVEPSTGNVFADIGLEDAAELLVKAQLAWLIRRQAEAKGLDVAVMVTTIGVAETRALDFAAGGSSTLSFDEYFHLLRQLDYQIELRLLEQTGGSLALTVDADAATVAAD